MLAWMHALRVVAPGLAIMLSCSKTMKVQSCAMSTAR